MHATGPGRLGLIALSLSLSALPPSQLGGPERVGAPDPLHALTVVSLVEMSVRPARRREELQWRKGFFNSGSTFGSRLLVLHKGAGPERHNNSEQIYSLTGFKLNIN